MSDTMVPERETPWRGGNPRRHSGIAWVAAVSGHALLLALLVVSGVRVPPPAVEVPAFTMVMAPVAADLVNVARAAVVPPAVTASVAPITHSLAAVTVPASLPHAAPARAAAAAPARPPVSGPAVPAAPAMSGAPAVDVSGEIARLSGLVSRAVQRAAVMPPAALRLGRQGRAQVKFVYWDGSVDDVTLTQSSASRMLDDAAVLAVRSARYPAAPAALAGRRIPMQVWVDFELRISTST